MLAPAQLRAQAALERHTLHSTLAVACTQVFALLCLLSPAVLALVGLRGGPNGRLLAFLYLVWYGLDFLTPWRGGRHQHPQLRIR